MKLYRRLKRVRSIEICDSHCVPLVYSTDWVEDDTISDEDLIKHAREQYGENFQYILQEKFMPYEQQESKWIPVTERLPEKSMPCLVSVGKFNLTQMATYSDLMRIIDHKIFYQGNYGYNDFEDITEYVKAWRPLPEPYNEKESENERTSES